MNEKILLAIFLFIVIFIFSWYFIKTIMRINETRWIPVHSTENLEKGNEIQVVSENKTEFFTVIKIDHKRCRIKVRKSYLMRNVKAPQGS